VSFAPKIKKTDGFVDFAEVDAEKVVAMQKAFIEWPGVYFSHKGVKFVLGKIEIVNKPGLDLVEAGKFFVDDGLFVKTKSGLLQLIELKPESKNFMLSTNFIRGNPNFF
jgi:methionyl-tRNA formyltransferase